MSSNQARTHSMPDADGLVKMPTESPTEDCESDEIVRIDTVPVEAPRGNWKLRQGDVLFWAAITDEVFLGRWERHEITLRHGDGLAVTTVIRGEPHDREYHREVTKVYRVFTAPPFVQRDVLDRVKANGTNPGGMN